MEQDIIRKGQVNKLLDLGPELNAGDDKKYKLKTICNKKVYVKETVDQLSRLYRRKKYLGASFGYYLLL